MRCTQLRPTVQPETSPFRWVKSTARTTGHRLSTYGLCHCWSARLEQSLGPCLQSVVLEHLTHWGWVLVMRSINRHIDIDIDIARLRVGAQLTFSKQKKSMNKPRKSPTTSMSNRPCWASYRNNCWCSWPPRPRNVHSCACPSRCVNSRKDASPFLCTEHYPAISGQFRDICFPESCQRI